MQAVAVGPSKKNKPTTHLEVVAVLAAVVMDALIKPVPSINPQPQERQTQVVAAAGLPQTVVLAFSKYGCQWLTTPTISLALS